VKIVDGENLQPLSGERPRQIVVLLHGYGSNGADLISLAPAWRQKLPHALFLAPNAPQRCGLSGGYQWWALNSFTPVALAAGAASASAAINDFIDSKLDEHDLKERHLALVGFSQGTMMALHVGLRRPTPVAAIVGYSGMLTGSPELSRQITARPPVLLVHGSADPVVPVAALHAAKHDLERLRVPVTAHVSPGVGHTVDPVGLRLGVEFLDSAFAEQEP